MPIARAGLRSRSGRGRPHPPREPADRSPGVRARRGVHVNGVDMIKWNAQGEIIEFKVMVWSLKAKMAAMLQAGAPAP